MRRSWNCGPPWMPLARAEWPCLQAGESAACLPEPHGSRQWWQSYVEPTRGALTVPSAYSVHANERVDGSESRLQTGFIRRVNAIDAFQVMLLAFRNNHRTCV